MTILCADGSISLEVLETNPKEGTVRVKCLNTATLGCVPCPPAWHASLRVWFASSFAAVFVRHWGIAASPLPARADRACLSCPPARACALCTACCCLQ